jgi:hypothetical protein
MSLWSFTKFVYAKLLTKELKTLDKMQLNFKERDFVMHIITRDIWKICQIALTPRLVEFWHIFQISLVVLIINCTPSRVITYTNVVCPK